MRQRIPQAEIAVGDEGGAIVLRVLDTPGEADRAAFLELGRTFGADVYLQTGGPDSVAPIDAEVRPLFYRLAAHDVRIDFEPGDFIQINARVNEAMVDAVVEAAAPAGSDRVLDLYCGLGNFTLPLARRVAAVLGVEGVAPLVARAARNAARNGFANVRFVAAHGTWSCSIPRARAPQAPWRQSLACGRAASSMSPVIRALWRGMPARSCESMATG
jgi:23S rRNA (uracil1939-C5)-methyltransferase